MDIAVVSLEIRSAGLKRASEEAASSLRLVGKAADEVTAKAPKAGKATDDAGKAQAKAAREAQAHAQALARLQRSVGDYDGAIKTLSGSLAKLEKDSTAALRVQSQIAQIQNQQRRVNAGATFEGFLGGFKNIEGQLSGISGVLQSLGNLPGLSGLNRVASAFTTIQSSAAGVTASITNLAPALASTGTAATTAAAGLGVAGVALGGVAVGIGALIGGAALGTKALFDMSVAGSNLADSLNDLSTITGLSVEGLSVIRGAAATSGSSIGEFTAAMGIFQQRLQEAATGAAPKAAAALKQFGIDAKQAAIAPEQAFLQFGQRLLEIQNSAERTATAKEFLGRSGAKLIPTFQALSESGGRFEQRARALGIVLGGDLTRAAGDLGDEVDLLGQQFEALQVRVAGQTGPAFVRVINEMQSAMAGLVPAAELAARGIAFVFEEEFRDLLALINLVKNAGVAIAGPAVAGTALSGIAAGQQRAQERAAQQRREFDAGIQSRGAIDPAISREVSRQFPRGTLAGDNPIANAARPGGARGGNASIPDIAGLNRTFDFLPAQLKEIDERSKALGRSTEDLNKAYLDAQRAATPLAEKLKILGPAAAQAVGEFLIARQQLEGQKLGEVDQARLAALRDRANQIDGALDATQKQFDDNTTSIKALADALQALRISSRLAINGLRQPNELPTLGVDGRSLLGLAPRPTFGNEVRDDAIQRGAQADQGISRVVADRNQYLARFEQDARNTFDNLFTGLLTGANTLRDTFGNFFLSLGDSVARRFSESITDKLFESVLNPFFDSVSKGFDKLTGYLSSIFSDLISSIAKPIGGFFGKLFGSAFGGGFASGGFLQPGQFGIVGERGPEFAFGGNAGMTIVNQQQMAARGGGSQNVTVNIYAQDAQSFMSPRSQAQIRRQMGAAVGAAWGG